MERLTKKEKKVVVVNNRNIGKNYLTIKQYEKLQELEDLEEELGIDLITLFKALKKGIWYKHNEMKVNPKYYDNNDRWDWCDFPYYIETKKIVIEYIKKFGLRKSNDKLLFFSVRAYDDWYELYFEDYGKTWALTREELKDD